MSSDLTTVEGKAVQTVTQMDDGNMLVVAEHPGQLQDAQKALVEWFTRKVKAIDAELLDARKSLSDARLHGWRVQPFQKVIRDLEVAYDYYGKAKTAVSEGYCIVPDFPVDVVAVRTSKDMPTGGEVTSGWRPTITEKAEKLPEGVGEYVDSNVKVTHGYEYEDKSSSGTLVKKHWWEASEFRDVALPVKFMKPRVLEATQHAMAMKIFDEIGVLPARRKSDPLVVGRILGPKGKSMTFLIAWFIDTKDL